MILAISISNVILGGCSQPETEDTEFIVSGGQVYRLNVYMEQNKVISGSWKADDAVYEWWTTPGGAAYYPMETHRSIIRKVVEPNTNQNLGLSPGFFIEDNSNVTKVEEYRVGRFSGDIYIKSEQSGYYTLCFMPYPYDTDDDVNVTVHYQIR